MCLSFDDKSAQHSTYMSLPCSWGILSHSKTARQNTGPLVSIVPARQYPRGLPQPYSPTANLERGFGVRNSPPAPQQATVLLMRSKKGGSRGLKPSTVTASSRAEFSCGYHSASCRTSQLWPGHLRWIVPWRIRWQANLQSAIESRPRV